MRTQNKKVNKGNNSTLLALSELQKVAPIHKFSEFIIELSHEVLLSKSYTQNYKSDVSVLSMQLVKFLNQLEK